MFCQITIERQKRVGASRPIDISKLFSPGTCLPSVVLTKDGGRAYCKSLIMSWSKQISHGGDNITQLQVSSIQNPASSPERRETKHAPRIPNHKKLDLSCLKTVQNKPNLKIDHMFVTKVLTSDYDKRTLGGRGKNKPNSNPIKPNQKKPKMNINNVLTRRYENSRLLPLAQNKPNQTQLFRGLFLTCYTLFSIGTNYYNSTMASKSKNDRFDSIREKIKTFPTGCGLYFMKAGGDTVLYIGKAKNLRSRVSSYFQPGSDMMSTRGPKILEMLNKVRTVDYLETKSEVDAVLQEARLVKDIHPPYNTHLVDDKTFPYLEITTRQDFPGVYITRNPKSSRSRLFGPFTGVKDLRAVLVVLQKIFKFRTCNLDIRADDPKRRFFRPCLLYSIKQCTAPCGARIEKGGYKQLIKDLVKFLQSKRFTVLRRLKKQMAQASTAMDYEAAALYRDRIRLIERLDDRGTVEGNVQPEVFAPDPIEALAELQKILKLSEPIRIIEGLDIAHIAGAETVGALVKFIDGRPFKSGYRRFKIKTVKKIDDYACMAEVVRRRYKHALAGEELWPDLILIDGGLGHLHTVAQTLKQMNAPLPALASLAKAKEEIFILGSNKPLKLASTSPAVKLLQYVRDEAHRFAQHYHHILRTKKTLNQKS